MKSTFQKSRSFTLVELLTVMVIVGILFGLVLAPYEKLVMGTGVDAATFQLNSGLRLARQKAISSRRRVAVLLPDHDVDNDLPDSLKHHSFAYAYVDSAGNYEEPVENTSIKFLSKGAVINLSNPDKNHPDYMFIEVQDVDWREFSDEFDNGDATADPNEVTDCRAIVFRPTGAITSGNEPDIEIVEGFVSGTGIQTRNADNHLNIIINLFTGRSKVE